MLFFVHQNIDFLALNKHHITINIKRKKTTLFHAAFSSNCDRVSNPRIVEVIKKCIKATIRVVLISTDSIHVLNHAIDITAGAKVYRVF